MVAAPDPDPVFELALARLTSVAHPIAPKLTDAPCGHVTARGDAYAIVRPAWGRNVERTVCLPCAVFALRTSTRSLTPAAMRAIRESER